jgi:hypothetical protein
MALSDFFRINLPYGIRKNSEGEWFAFNREYLPLGWNDYNHSKSKSSNNGTFSDYPIYTKYKGLTEKAILKIISDTNRIQRNKDGDIEFVFFYKDATNPQSNPKHWEDYFNIIKAFSKYSKVVSI